MVARTDRDNAKQSQQTKDQANDQASGGMGDFIQPQQPQVQASTELQGFLNTGFGSFVDGALGASAATVVKSINEFLKEKNNKSPWKVDIISHAELPKGQLVAFYGLVGNQAYVHPILFGERGGRQEQQTVNNGGIMGGMEVIQTAVSDATIVRNPVFKTIIANYFSRTELNISADNVIICGATIYFEGIEIAPNNLVGNATNEIQARMYSLNNVPNPNSIKLPDFKGTEVCVDVKAQVDKKDIHDRPVFAPIVVNTTVRKKSEFAQQIGSEDNQWNQQQQNSVVSLLGESTGYIDMAPISQEARQAALQRINSGMGDGRTQPASFKAFYNITSMSWGSMQNTMPTAENILAQLIALPALVDGGVWVNRTVTAEAAGFDPLYDFASVGYDAPSTDGTRAPYTESKTVTQFGPEKQAAFASKSVEDLTIRQDFPLAGPNAGILADLLNVDFLNQAVQNLTGQAVSYKGIGVNLGMVPLGTYDHKGTKRDIREVMNYFAWTKWHNGDIEKMREYFAVWMLAPQTEQHAKWVYRKRLEHCQIMSQDTFELTDQALRIEYNLQLIKELREYAATSCGINFISAQRRSNFSTDTYGFGSSTITGLTTQGNGMAAGGGMWVSNGMGMNNGMGY